MVSTRMVPTMKPGGGGGVCVWGGALWWHCWGFIPTSLPRRWHAFPSVLRLGGPSIISRTHLGAAPGLFDQDGERWARLQLTWPPRSPDLRPAEMVWDEMEGRVKPKGARHLWEDWEPFQVDDLVKLIERRPTTKAAIPAPFRTLNTRTRGVLPLLEQNKERPRVCSVRDSLAVGRWNSNGFCLKHFMVLELHADGLQGQIKSSGWSGQHHLSKSPWSFAIFCHLQNGNVDNKLLTRCAAFPTRWKLITDLSNGYNITGGKKIIIKVFIIHFRSNTVMEPGDLAHL